MELAQLAADRRDADGVLEQPARIRVVPVGRRGIRPQRRSAEHAHDDRAQPVVVHLGDEELEEALQLVGVAAQRRRHRRRVDAVRRLERAHVELERVAELLDASEHAHGVAFAEAPVEQLDVVPDARGDAAARVDELEREVRRAVLRPQPLLLRDGVDAFDGAVLLELRDRGHAP